MSAGGLYAIYRQTKIFLAGHSLGGLLAPLIATRCPSVTGLILLAAPSRPQDDILKEQIRYLGSLNGNTDETLLAQQYQQVKAAAPQIYWDYLDKYAPVMTACSLSVPMLFLQGERDYQVTMQDFAMWKLGMFGKTNATFLSYPTLNHCFMEGTGKSTPMEYNHPARVSGKVMEDIAKWVTQE